MKPARKGLYILPSLFTVASIFCGLLAIILMFRAQGAADVYKAAMLIGLGMLLDSFDGRVARMTNTQSEFGVQLDSLADVITFGVAPAIVMYEYALQGLGFFGVFAAFCFTACGALRLARFNVQASSETGPSTHFVGLPIPAGAGVTMSFVLLMTASGHFRAPEASVLPAAALMIGVGLLMVSTVRFKTFKKMRVHLHEKLIVGSVLAIFVLLSVTNGFSAGLAATMVIYLSMGLGGAAIKLGARGLRAVRSGSSAALSATEDVSEDGDDAIELRLSAPDDEQQ
ncbi:MAG: CDP-diacylglycerol--serine O-phosphatidyltransferase [Myxococcota bacterium]|jgi:CDP-diacylglycerol--serine O-phosphatidyltransferase|nr:CDP-diacylglycerol--serine O-phosphatidyltransferase [Myxococcota bacterium]